MNRNYKPSPKIDEENPYWISFSDLMSAILVIFILATVSLIIELTQRTQKVDQGIENLKKGELVRKKIISDVVEDLNSRNVKVYIADNETVIRIPEETLTFRSGDDKIPYNMINDVKTIGTVLHQAILKKNRYEFLDTIFIEGHTDSVPIATGRYNTKGNWGLSADRAITVWKLWTESLDLSPSLLELVNQSGEKLFSVSGYAASRKIQFDESTHEKRKINRRIDIRFTVKAPTIKNLEEIKSAK